MSYNTTLCNYGLLFKAVFNTVCKFTTFKISWDVIISWGKIKLIVILYYVV